MRQCRAVYGVSGKQGRNGQIDTQGFRGIAVDNQRPQNKESFLSRPGACAGRGGLHRKRCGPARRARQGASPDVIFRMQTQCRNPLLNKTLHEVGESFGPGRKTERIIQGDGVHAFEKERVHGVTALFRVRRARRHILGDDGESPARGGDVRGLQVRRTVSFPRQEPEPGKWERLMQGFHQPDQPGITGIVRRFRPPGKQ